MARILHPRGWRGIGSIAWFAGWAMLLAAVHRPWRDLGGLVSDRLIWLERFLLASGLVVGATVASIARDPARRPNRRARAARRVLYPPVVGCAIAMVFLRATGREDGIGVLLSALLSYTGGSLSLLLEIGSTGGEDDSRGRPSADDGADRSAPGGTDRGWFF